MAEKRESNQEVVAHAMYECLNCRNKKQVRGKRDEYSEVRVCPLCSKGAFVDIWKIEKYKNYVVKGLDLSTEEDHTTLAFSLNVDCSDALTGLKAITREAKKATAALKELEQQQTELLSGQKKEGYMKW